MEWNYSGDPIPVRSTSSGFLNTLLPFLLVLLDCTPPFPLFLSSPFLFDYLPSAYLFSAQLWNILGIIVFPFVITLVSRSNSLWSPSLPAQQTCPKLSCPPDFNEEHHNGCAFLNSYSLYICLAPEQFHNEQKRILWALTFFKGGRAAKWSENVFRQEVDTGVFPIQTWGDFKQFWLHFFPANVEADAINTLEGTSYHQGNQIVDVSGTCRARAEWPGMEQSYPGMEEIWQ